MWKVSQKAMMLQYDAVLQAALDKGKAGDPVEFLRKVAIGAGVHQSVVDETLSQITVRWEDDPPYDLAHPDSRVRGWYWDDVAVIPVQCEGALHEFNHGWYFTYMQKHPDEALALDLQIAMYAQLELDKAPLLDVEPGFLEFCQGYYYGIGEWLGMYDLDGTGSTPKVTYQELLAAFKRHDAGAAEAVQNVITWENMGGFASWLMGWLTKGPHRLPYGMRYLLQPFFTGNPIFTPYYLPGGVP